MDVAAIKASVEEVSEHLDRLRLEIGKVIVGQGEMVEGLLVALLTGGHVLLEGVPGLAKTTAIKTLADGISTRFQRIQFTPDLLPSDLIGTLIYNPHEGKFSTKKGPIFANIILADEINRAPSKVQSALLEAMQERQVSIGDTTYPLDEPFLVLATQNPIEQEGTYPLPEAQVDRFMLKIHIGYPTREEERKIVDMALENDHRTAKPVLSAEQVFAMREVVHSIYCDDRVRDYCVDLVVATRDPKSVGLEDVARLVEFGASPRASIFLGVAARAGAFIAGRGYVTPQDVKNVAHDILRHRILLTYEAEAEEVTSDNVIDQLLEKVPVPEPRSGLRVMDTSEVLAQVKRIQIVANRQVNDLLAGEYLSVFKGRGMEFDEVREYAPGDDVRTIDWNVTARTSVPHVKRYAEERELTILFLVDISRSGVFGSGDRAKLDLATELAAVLMFSALKNNDKVGLALFGEQVEHYWPPRKGKGNVLRLIRELVAAEPTAGGTDVGAALEFARRVCRRKAVLFLLSDMPEGDFEDELRIANRRHDVVAISVGDRRDRTLAADDGGGLPGVGFVRMLDAETGRVVYRDLRNRGLRDAYAEQAALAQRRRAETLRRAGVDELAVDTGRSYVSDLHQFFRMRERRIGQGR